MDAVWGHGSGMVTPDLRIGGTTGTESGRNSCDAFSAQEFVSESTTANAISGTQPMHQLFADGEPDRWQRSAVGINAQYTV